MKEIPCEKCGRKLAYKIDGDPVAHKECHDCGHVRFESQTLQNTAFIGVAITPLKIKICEIDFDRVESFEDLKTIIKNMGFRFTFSNGQEPGEELKPFLIEVKGADDGKEADLP